MYGHMFLGSGGAGLNGQGLVRKTGSVHDTVALSQSFNVGPTLRTATIGDPN